MPTSTGETKYIYFPDSATGPICLRFSWILLSQNAEQNYSTVIWNLSHSARDGKIDSEESKSWTVIFNGVTYRGSVNIGLNEGENTAIAEGVATIKHSPSGSASFSYSFRQQYDTEISDSFVGTVSGSGYVSLPSIQRASIPSLISFPESTQNIGFFGDEITVYTNRSFEQFTHTVRYKFGAQEGVIGENVGTDIKWTVPLSLMTEIPNATQGTGFVYVDTYEAGAKVGTEVCIFTARVPDSIKPSCSAEITDTKGISDIYGSPVKDLSRLRIKVIVEPAYESEIVSYNISFAGGNYIASDITTDFIKSAGDIPLSVTVTDSRGRTGYYNENVTVLDYTRPSISKLAVHRCDLDGTENDQGEYTRISFSANVMQLGSNTATYSLRYKKTSETVYSAQAIPELNNVFSVEDHSVILETDGNHSYDIALDVSDSHSRTSSATSVSTAFTLINFGADGKSICFGGVVESEDEGFISFKMPIKIANTELSLTSVDVFVIGDDHDAGINCKKSIGGVVELSAVIAPKSSDNPIGTDAGAVICYLPTGYRPSSEISQLCYGTGKATWVLSIFPNGNVTAGRYGITSYQTPSVSTYMRLHITFFAED